MTTNIPTPPAQPKLPVLPDAKADLRRAMHLLAREIAMELETPEVIIARKGMTPEQFAKIQENPFYKRVFEAETEVWRSPLNAEQRVRIQAAFMLEHTLPDYWVRLQDPNKREALSGITEGVKTLAKLAGIGEKGPDVDTGKKFMININLGGGMEISREVKTVETSPGQIEGTVNPPEISPHVLSPHQ